MSVLIWLNCNQDGIFSSLLVWFCFLFSFDIHQVSYYGRPDVLCVLLASLQSECPTPTPTPRACIFQHLNITDSQPHNLSPPSLFNSPNTATSSQRSHLKTGRCGPYLFEGDTDLDEAVVMSRDAGIELYNYEIDPKDPEHGGKGLEATCAHLNSGVLNELFDKYDAQDDSNAWVGKEFRLMILAALAMRVGATITPSHITLLRTFYPRIPISPTESVPLYETNMPDIVEQFEIALAHYKNDGTPYDFYAERCSGPGCDRADDELAEGEKLQKCGRCKKLSYCGRRCQKAHWKRHKRGCREPREGKYVGGRLYVGQMM